MSDINVSVCSETGICSIIKSGTSKVDLMPGELDELKSAAGNVDNIRNIIAEADPSFAKDISDDEINQIVSSLT